MRTSPPTTGDAERDELVAAIVDVNSRMHERSMELVGPMELPADLTMQQMRVLGLIAQTPGMTGHELRCRLGVTAPTASGLIDRLAEKGLVERVDDETDRRVRRLHLTPVGVRTVGGVNSMFEKLMATMLPAIPTEDLAAIRAGSEAMLRAVESVLATRLGQGVGESHS